MALTWKNVDAPNFNGAGALFESAQNSFNNSLGILQAAADRAAAQRKAAASAQMLTGLAGVQRGGVADFLAAQDPTMLTPEALQIALGQEDVLAGRAAKEVQLQDAQADLAHQEGTRAGDLASRAARAQAQLALSQGNFAEANRITDSQSGYALDDAMLTFGRDVDEQTFQNDTRQRLSQLVKDNDSIDAARIKVMNGNYSEREKAALYNQLNSMSDADFSRVDPNIPDVFTGSQLDQDNKIRSATVQDSIQSNLMSSPTHQYDMHLKNLTVVPEGTPEGDDSAKPGKLGGYSDPIKYLSDQMGMQTDSGIFRRGMASNIENAKAKANARLKDKGIQVSDWEIAAAIASTRETGSRLIPFTGGTDEYFIDEDAAVDLAVKMKDPDQRKEQTKSDMFYTDYSEKLAAAADNIQKARKSYNIAVSKNSGTAEDKYNKAIEAEAAYNDLLKQYEAERRSMDAQSGAPAAPATPAPVAQAQAPVQAAPAPVAVPATIPPIAAIPSEQNLDAMALARQEELLRQAAQSNVPVPSNQVIQDFLNGRLNTTNMFNGGVNANRPSVNELRQIRW